jgi:hypothetical protein
MNIRNKRSCDALCRKEVFMNDEYPKCCVSNIPPDWLYNFGACSNMYGVVLMQDK